MPVVVALLLALGVSNIALRARLHQVEDGVLWADRAEGVTAVEVAAGSPAARAGIQRGDVILAINGAPIESRAEVTEYQHRGSEGTRLSYTLEAPSDFALTTRVDALVAGVNAAVGSIGR